MLISFIKIFCKLDNYSDIAPIKHKQMEQEFKFHEGIEVEGFVVDVEIEYHIFTSRETRTEPSTTQEYYAGMDIKGVFWDDGQEVSEDFFKDRVTNWETKILKAL